ncbi:hypothetical protein DPX16_22137 [Anabarilius grahami]|uniref:Uncharacterized protein n=1 Tax=Anabarilius grahami TaxID=495550 RepID=A0A3N0XNE2_ANAGA|nr:hypothetical protein DPX16_22137 [Anabarilius grahami]
MQSQKFHFSLRLSGRHVTGSFESSFRFLREEDADVLRIRRGSLSPEPENKEKWLKMSYETEKSCLLAPQESQTPYGCLTANEKYEIPGMGEDSVLEMLSYSKFSDLETWLCMPSTLLPRSRDSICSMLPPSHENDNGDTYKETRPPENESSHLSQCQERKTHLLPPSPLLPVSASPHSSSPLRTTSTPLPKPTRDSCHGGVSVRKRRRLAASPGGLHWDASEKVLFATVSEGKTITATSSCSFNWSVLRDHDRGETSSLSEVKRFPRTVNLESRVPELWRDREALRKTISVDDRLLQQTPSENHRLLSRLERGKKKLRNINFHSCCVIAVRFFIDVQLCNRSKKRYACPEFILEFDHGFLFIKHSSVILHHASSSCAPVQHKIYILARTFLGCLPPDFSQTFCPLSPPLPSSWLWRSLAAPAGFLHVYHSNQAARLITEST